MAITPLSTEFVQDSASSDDEHNVTSQNTKVSAQISDNNGPKSMPASSKKRVEHTSSSSEQDSSSDSASSSRSTSSKRSSRSRDGVSENPTSHKSLRRPANGIPASQPARKKSKSSKLPAYIPSHSYRPPAGYEPVRSSSSTDLDFDIDDASSKQVWLITAPASVSLASITSLDISAALKGAPILEHNDARYNMHAMSAPGVTLLLPSNVAGEERVQYQQVDLPVSRSLHLREMTQIRLPKKPAKDGSEAPLSSQAGEMGKGFETDGSIIKFTAERNGSTKEIRQQPQGLVKRYHPYGSATSGQEKMPNPESADVVEGVALSDDTFIAPPPVMMDVDDDRVVETPKKDKRSRKEKLSTPKSSQQSTSSNTFTAVMSPASTSGKRRKVKESA